MEKAQVPTLFVAPPCLIPARMRYHAEEILVAAAAADGVLAAQTVKNPRQGMFNVVEDVALQGRAWLRLPMLRLRYQGVAARWGRICPVDLRCSRLPEERSE